MNLDRLVIHICFALLFIFLLLGCGPTLHKGSLASTVKIELPNNWVFHADTSPHSFYEANVPGTIHTDLFSAGLIDDPFFGNNEIKLRQLEDIRWHYKTTFNLNKKQLTQQHLNLIFSGLDTYADIILNGQRLGQTENMFRTWTFDIGPFAKSENTLEVVFIPPGVKHRSKASTLGYTLPADNEEGAIKVSPFSRKAPYHFGWDWGPRMVTAGIWKPVYLEYWQGAKINEASITTPHIKTNQAEMLATLFIDSDVANQTIEVRLDEYATTHQLTAGENKIEIPFIIPYPKLWWPNGSGDAHLYEKSISVFNNDRLLDKKQIKFGVRTVELINEKDSIGTSFYFIVNGQPLFMQGANYIPQDVFIPRVTHKQYRTLLGAAQDAHMNMIRVWGGGIYEQDIFYDLCDSLGLLVWQDFMFTGTMYPGDDSFLRNVTAEITEQVRRLNKHPSLALFCGNNELEVAWQNWGWQKKYGYSAADSAIIWNDYIKLFHNIIPSIVQRASPMIGYTPTSPLSNWGTAENFNHSSMHYWGVWHGRDSFNSFKQNVGRFMVEYGMQSYPELSTVQEFANFNALNLGSDIMKNRQKSYIGNDEILKHIRQHFHEPTSFEEFISLSQASQAKALEIAIRAHKDSDGHCMGTLLWQLNDCWPGPSWSIIDFYGNKKKGYEVVKREFGVKR